MAREIAETPLPRYKVDASGDLVPDVRAAAAIIYDPETNEILWEENSQSQRSIASITKVMTATVFLENNPDVTEPVTIARSDVFQASTTHLRANDRVTVDDLLHLLLIASDNAVARALARHRRAPRDITHEREGTELGLQMSTRIRRDCCRKMCRPPTIWRG
jgi:D-alanyl-D-alanine endopeptidase (penicillin-binding protein 7)